MGKSPPCYKDIHTIPYIPYHTIPYHTIPYHTIPHHTIPYHTIPYHTIPYHTTPYHTIPYHTIPYNTMFTILLTTPFLLSLSLGAPQYGGVQPSHPAPLGHTTIQCRTEYGTVWDTQYKETETQVCTTEYEKVCHTETQRLRQPTTRQECSTVYEKACETVYKSVCVEQYKTEYEPYTETECSTQYKEDCEYQWEGHGNNKVWAPIAGTCKNNPYETCKDVTKTKERQVAYPVCDDVPQQKCVDV